jgi:alkylhydroperoxidase family enzyme
VGALIAGRATDVTPVEREIIRLAREAHERPRLLAPSALDPLRGLVGDGALDYALVLVSFHFVNRMADLLHVSPEVLPQSLRRFEAVRRVGTWMASVLIRNTMDMENRDYTRTYEEVLEEIAPAFKRACGQVPIQELAVLRDCPKLIEALQLMLEERQERSGLDSKTLARIHRVVEAALPEGPADLNGSHERPSDPVEAFAFVGTRYAARTTERMIEALRAAGYDDLGILDLAIAVADANTWARLYRLTGLPPQIGYIAETGDLS